MKMLSKISQLGLCFILINFNVCSEICAQDTAAKIYFYSALQGLEYKIGYENSFNWEKKKDKIIVSDFQLPYISRLIYGWKLFLDLKTDKNDYLLYKDRALSIPYKLFNEEDTLLITNENGIKIIDKSFYTNKNFLSVSNGVNLIEKSKLRENIYAHTFVTQIPNFGANNLSLNTLNVKNSLSIIGVQLPYLSSYPVLFINKLGLPVEKLITANSREYIRLSAPVVYHHNKYMISGDIGYGLNDKQFKFGSNVFFLLNKIQTTLHLTKDIVEPGIEDFATKLYDKIELLRLLSIYKFDEIWKLGINFHKPIGNFRNELSFSNELRKSYQFINTIEQKNNAGIYLVLSYEIAFVPRSKSLEINKFHTYDVSQPIFLGLRLNEVLGHGINAFKAQLLLSENISPNVKIKFALTQQIGLYYGKTNYSYSFGAKGNAVDFNTSSKNVFETLKPTSYYSTKNVELFNSLTVLDIFGDVLPFHPRFVSSYHIGLANYQYYTLADISRITFVSEAGLQLQNIFTFPIPILEPKVGFGVFTNFGNKNLNIEKGESFIKFSLDFF